VRDLRNFIKNVEKDSVAALEKVLADLWRSTRRSSPRSTSRTSADEAVVRRFFEKMLGESEES
jgi:hypothetical protein